MDREDSASPNKNVLISAIVCTYNRVDYLKSCLQSLEIQTADKSLYEIIVVDNACTDNTKQVIFTDFRSVVNLRYVYEPTPGLSYARNTGYKNARGQYVAFIDDDAVACPEWLSEILWAFENIRPRPAVVSGPIKPIPGSKIPDWFPKEKAYEWVLSIYEVNSAVPVRVGEITGANMTFLKTALEEMGGFDTNLGRTKRSLMGGEESKLAMALRKKGAEIYYLPKAIVFHAIPEFRKTRGYFLRRFFYNGFSQAIIDLNSGQITNRQFFSMSMENMKKLVLYAIRSALSLIDERGIIFFGETLSCLGWSFSAITLIWKDARKRVTYRRKT